MKNTRFKITIFMMLAWVCFGIYGIEKQVNLVELAAYFASAASFLAPYMIGRSIRGADATSNPSE